MSATGVCGGDGRPHMTTQAATLTEFLLRAIGEDEADAREYSDDDSPGTWRRWGEDVCKAHRAIVEGHRGLHVCPNLIDDGYTDYSADDGDDGYRPCPTLRALASIWSDHADYRQEWTT